MNSSKNTKKNRRRRLTKGGWNWKNFTNFSSKFSREKENSYSKTEPKLKFLPSRTKTSKSYVQTLT